jgi:REP element-mobilizing transposase RayT
VGLNDCGCIVAGEIRRTTQVRPNTTIHDWIVMPDHVHMIIAMEPNNCSSTVETHRRCVSTWVDECIPLCRRRPGTLGSIVAQFKSVCTKRIRAMGYADFAWQSNYHERIVRSDAMEQRIRQYITENPLKWEP